MLDKSFLIRCFGFPAMLIHGDTSVLDRWRRLKRALPVTNNGERLLDVGCGTGAFTIGAARRGYNAIGLSWNHENQAKALQRAKMVGIQNIDFPVIDIRKLHLEESLVGQFDTVICLEVVEHILDDRKLIIDIANCLKPGGALFLTTPNYHYRALAPSENGPFLQEETGDHVRRGYTHEMLRELCAQADLRVELIDSCTGFFSQKITLLWRKLPGFKAKFSVILFFRPLPVLFDQLIAKLIGWPDYSLCLVAYKPRWPVQT